MSEDAKKPKQVARDDIPGDVLVSCPMRNAMVHPHALCWDCPEFGGIGVINEDDRIPWPQRHMVICRFRRKLAMVPLAAS